MIENDTIKLLRECDAGIKMGISSINDVVGQVESDGFRSSLQRSMSDHKKLDRQIQALLKRYHDDGKKPNPIAQKMSGMKTGAMLAMKPGDKTIAGLMTDGCDMGVKSLSRYLNQYEAADEQSKNIAKDLINLEIRLCQEIRPYL